MIGMLPINAAPINSGSIQKVVEFSAAGRGTASKAGATAVRSINAKARSVAALLVVGSSASARVRAVVHGVLSATGQFVPARVHAMAAHADASARKSTARASTHFSVGRVLASARCAASPVATLINAAYFTITARGLCSAGGAPRANVIKAARSQFYNFARAGKARAMLSAGRKFGVYSSVQASFAKAYAVRKVNASSGDAMVVAEGARPFMLASRVAKAAGFVHAVIVKAGIAFSEVFEMVLARARVAVVKPPKMVTWMYAHEPDYRTVFVRNDASTTRMRTFRKQPHEVLPYDIDFEKWLAPLHGDDIESAQVSVVSAVNGNPGDLSIDNVVIIIKNPAATMDVEPVRVKVWLSGGAHGATYKITARIDTEGGRRKEVDFRLMVREV